MPFLKDFEPILSENVPLARLTSMKVGGPARFLFQPRSVAELTSLIAALAGESIAWRIIGGGTNIIAADAGFPGALIRLAGDFTRIAFDGHLATAGAAAPLARFVRECAELGLSGAEGLVGIPGTIGGALVMNAGGRWGSISDILDYVRILDETGLPRLHRACEINFSYRASSLKGLIILEAGFVLAEAAPADVARATRDYLDRKRASQDLGASSAGCVFRNPPEGPSAGELIDRAGLKGASVGGALVSHRHANFIVNAGSATAKDVLELVEIVRKRVFEVSGVQLQPEVHLW